LARRTVPIGVSLLSTWFLITLTAGACVLLLSSVALTYWRTVVGAVGIAAAIVAVVGTWLELARPFHSGYPDSFYLWGALPILALVLAVWTWRGARWWRRALRIGAFPVTLAFAAATINAHYAYYPTLAALGGKNARHQVSVQTVTSLVQEAQATDVLPEHGVVESMMVPPERSGFDARGAFVYLPPMWFSRTRPRLPVLMLISGSPGTPADWTRSAGADALLDDFASQHGGLAPILVMPDVNGGPLADTECVDGPRGNAETYVAEDVRRFIVDTFGTRSDASSWAVGGLSEGGTCALTLTLRHPNLFGSFVDFGGQIAPMTEGNELQLLYGGNRDAWLSHQPLHLLDHQSYPGLAGWFESGTRDRSALTAARRLAPLVAAAGGQTCALERDGLHNFTFWHDGLRNALPWIVARLGLTSDDTAAACTNAGGHLAAPGS
jgi:S-formylglutathione hydrolase FrmB